MFQMNFFLILISICFVFFFRFVIIAQDGGVPRKQSIVQVTINIERNPSPPQFIQRQYVVVINESTPINTDILQVSAQDNDKVS